MRALAAEKPTLWIIEDLHYAPSESYQLVLSLARALTSHRVLLLLTARPGIPDGEMANFSRNQIMGQAGTAMLAQANAVPQNVLSLIR